MTMKAASGPRADRQACLHAGLMLELGIGGEVDLRTASRYHHRTLRRQTHANTVLQIPSSTNIRSYYERAAGQGDAEAQTQAGRRCYVEGDYLAAKHHWEAAAAQVRAICNSPKPPTHARTSNYVRNLKLNREEIPKILGRIVIGTLTQSRTHNFRTQGHARGTGYLALLYLHGRPMHRDLARAAHQLAAASMLGDTYSGERLAVLDKGIRRWCPLILAEAVEVRGLSPLAAGQKRNGESVRPTLPRP